MISKIVHSTLIILTLSTYAFSQFNDINTISGIEHSHVSPDLLGGGVGIIDLNNDGLEDIYLTGGVFWDKMYLNKGNLQFIDISTESFVFQATRKTQTTGVTVGDINNDGFDDAFITTQKNSPPILLLNSGKNTFEDITAKAGLGALLSWNMGAAMLDVNKDGYLDIYVINYIDEFNAILDESGELVGYDHSCAENYLLVNNRNNTFTNLANEYNVAGLGCSLSTSIVDINNDGYDDIMVANDFGEWIIPNELFIFNNEQNQFNENAISYNLNDSIYGMGIGVGDYNNDNCLDFYFTNIGSNRFKVKEQNTYLSKEVSFNIENGEVNQLNTTGWGSLFIDFDNDSFEDIYVSNGFIRTADFIETSVNDPNKLYRNVNGIAFEDISEISNTANQAMSRGVVKADLNNDGYPDLVCINTEAVRFKTESNTNVFSNTSSDNNWLSIHLIGTNVNKNAFGSSATVYYSNMKVTKYLNSGGSHASSSSRKLFFGLASHTQIDSIEIKWSDLAFQRFKDVPINSNIRLTQNQSDIDILSCEINNWGCSSIEDPLSILNNRTSSIYPNPVRNILKIENETTSSSYSILNLSGQILMQGYLHSNGYINVSNLANGYYLLNISGTIHKFLVKR